MALLDSTFGGQDPDAGFGGLLARILRGAPDIPAAAPNFDLARPVPMAAPVGVGAGSMSPIASFEGAGQAGPPAQGFGDMPYRGMLSDAVPVPLPRPRPAEAPVIPAAMPEGSLELPARAAPATDMEILKKAATSAPAGSPLSRIGDFLNNHSNTLLAIGAGLSGAPSFGQGMSRAFAAAGPAMQADQRQMFQNATVGALMNKGLSHNDALAVAGNPALLQQVAPAMFGPKAWTITHTKNWMGDEIPLAVDPTNPARVMPLTGPGAGQLTSSTAVGTGSVGAGTGSFGPSAVGQEKWDAMTPDERLATLPGDVSAMLKGMYAGTTAPNSRFVSKLLPTMNSVYGTDFNQQDYQKRLDTVKSFTGQGKNALEVKAMETGIQHANELAKPGGLIDMIDKTGNMVSKYWPDWFREGSQAFEKYKGNTEFQQAKGRYDTQVESLATEISKALNGGVTALKDRNEWRELLKSSRTPDELHSTINQAMDVLEKRLNVLGNQYTEGTKSAREGHQLLSPETAKIFRQLRGLEPQTAAAAGTAPTTSAAVPAQPAAGGVPKEVQGLPLAEQMRRAPDGSVVRIGQQRMQKSGGTWQPLQ